jgi:hypothetical protein
MSLKERILIDYSVMIRTEVVLHERLTINYEHLYRNFIPYYIMPGSRGSSVSTVSGYGLDDRTIEVRYLAEAKRFFLYLPCSDRPNQPPVQWVLEVLSSGLKGG